MPYTVVFYTVAGRGEDLDRGEDTGRDPVAFQGVQGSCGRGGGAQRVGGGFWSGVVVRGVPRCVPRWRASWSRSAWFSAHSRLISAPVLSRRWRPEAMLAGCALRVVGAAVVIAQAARPACPFGSVRAMEAATGCAKCCRAARWDGRPAMESSRRGGRWDSAACFGEVLVDESNGDRTFSDR
jgi:hypothetical protein